MKGVIANGKTSESEYDCVQRFIAKGMHIKFSFKKNNANGIINCKWNKVWIACPDYAKLFYKNVIEWYGEG